MLSSIKSDIFRIAHLKNGNGNGNGYHTNGNGNGHNGNGNGDNGNDNGDGNGIKANGNGHNGNGTNSKNGDSNNPLFKHRHLSYTNGNGNGCNGNGHNGNGHATNGNGHNGNGYGNGNGHDGNGNGKTPFVSIHIATYNEKNVVNRILEACTSFEYPEYEVIVADDSTDETVEILEKWKPHPRVKVVRRENRTGFKGGALKQAVKHMDPRAEYVMVFDADFIPPPDIIQQMLVQIQFLPNNNGHNGNGYKANGNGHNGNGHNGNGFKHRLLHLKNGNGHNGNGNGYHRNGNGNENGNGNGNGQNGNGNGSALSPEEKTLDLIEAWVKDRETAAVQGYQWHVLNASENWLTRGIRAEYSGNYLVERSFQEKLGGLKMIAGSVFMIKASILKRYGWSPSLTEDWDLTLRLYKDGYDVKFTPYVAAPAECPSTLLRLIRQRMRWAEGHTFAVKKYFWQLLRSPLLNWREKLEFLYYAPYYLQSVFFTVGTVAWLLSEWFKGYLPFWAAVFGWSLVLTNLIALPLTNLSGLFLEYDAKRDGGGILAAVLLSYVLVPFQAIAAIKGLFEDKEGVWFRTFKTGKITEKAIFFRLRKAFKNLGKVPGRKTGGKSTHRATELGVSKKPFGMGLTLSLTLLLLGVFLASNNVHYARALHTPTSITLWPDAACGVDINGDLVTTAPATATCQWRKNKVYKYTSTGTYNLDSTDTGTWTVNVDKITTGSHSVDNFIIAIWDGATETTVGSSGAVTLNAGANTINIAVTISQTYTGVNIRLNVDTAGTDFDVEEGTDASGDTKLVSVPEYSLFLLFLAPFLPVLRKKLRRR